MGEKSLDDLVRDMLAVWDEFTKESTGPIWRECVGRTVEALRERISGPSKPGMMLELDGHLRTRITKLETSVVPGGSGPGPAVMVRRIRFTLPSEASAPSVGNDVEYRLRRDSGAQCTGTARMVGVQDDGELANFELEGPLTRFDDEEPPAEEAAPAPVEPSEAVRKAVDAAMNRVWQKGNDARAYSFFAVYQEAVRAELTDAETRPTSLRGPRLSSTR